MASEPIPFMRGVEILRGRAALELIMVRHEALRRMSCGPFADDPEDHKLLEHHADERAELDFDDA